MGDHNLYIKPTKLDWQNGLITLICGLGMVVFTISVHLDWFIIFVFLVMSASFLVPAYLYLTTGKYAYKNRLGLRYLNTLHGVRWKWGEGHERITKRFESAGYREPRDSEITGHNINTLDVETYGVALFIDRLRQGKERIDISLLNQEQLANFVFDLRVLGTEFQRGAEKVKRTIEDSSLATQYQDLALFCQKEAKRMEHGGVITTDTEVTSASATAPQGQLEELPNIGGTVRLIQQEGRVTELCFYGLPPGEYAITMNRQTKTIQFNDGATSIPIAEFGVSPQAHGAFMIDAPDGTGDAVRW